MNLPGSRGTQFEDRVADALLERQWTILGRHTEVDGIEVDFVAIHPEHPRQWLLECKGGDIPSRSGLARTDTVKKAIGTAWGLRNSERVAGSVYFLVGSMLPSPRSLAHELLREAVEQGLFHGVGTIESLVSYADTLSGRLQAGGFARTLMQ